jgi:hypothetical protein
MTIQEAAQTALDVQDAVNLSAVARSLVSVLDVLWTQAREEGKGTDYVNTHPIVTLFLDKLTSLNHGDVLSCYPLVEEMTKKVAVPDWMTAKQVEAVHNLYTRDRQGVSREEFFRKVENYGDYCGLSWCGMFIGIEKDGYTHS